MAPAGDGSQPDKIVARNDVQPPPTDELDATSPPPPSSSITTKPTAKHILHQTHIALCILILFVNYFLAQYDKFILSYFRSSVVSSLHLSAPQYALLSGYSTGIVQAVLALPIAFVADYTSARVWILGIAACWWSLCVVFQGLVHSFGQMYCARLAMGIGQAAVEPLSVSLISDLVGWRNVFLGESVFYVGVYVGEAVSGQIATAFTNTGTSWQVAMRAIGITGIVVAVLIRLLLREPKRRKSLVQRHEGFFFETKHDNTNDNHNEDFMPGTVPPVPPVPPVREHSFTAAKADLVASFAYITRMRSFWLLVLSASMRQLAGNVFGYYMPGYLSNVFPSKTELLSRYGIIVGTVGSLTVLAGGALTSLLWHKTKLTPIYLTSIGGMFSSIFVLLMVFSKDIADGSEDRGVNILYGTMCGAYFTAEAWLGCLFALIALLLPPTYKTFGLAIWGSLQVLIYSSGPEIIGLALRKTSPKSAEYTQVTQTALAVIIPVGYWACAIGLLSAIPLLRRDMRQEFVRGPLSIQRRIGFGVFGALIFALVVTLFTVSLVYKA